MREHALHPGTRAFSNLTRMSNSTRMLPQLEAVREGFYQVMPKDVLSKFTELELELLLHGMPFIDVEVSVHVCCQPCICMRAVAEVVLGGAKGLGHG